ncbi:MAG: GTP 3',8-cyclase MoaA [archaeon]
MTRDRFGREIDILRISVTQDCNMRCPYCHREGECGAGKEMSTDDIVRIARASSRLGIRRVKITGGEPLLRSDIIDIVRGVSSVPGIETVSMTTNGTMLEGMARELSDAGLTRINIGCDSFSSSVLEKTADRIKPGIMAAKEAGFDAIKLNMVVLAGVNDSDIDDMMEFAKKTGTILQLIELIRTKHNEEFFTKHFFSLSDIEKKLASDCDSFERRPVHGRKRYDAGGASVEVVRPHNHEFCANCRTIRVSSEGRIKPCLMRDDNLVDVDFSDDDDELLARLVLAIDRREPFVKSTLEAIT